MNYPPFGPFGFAQGLEPVERLRLRPHRPPLNVSPESLDFTRDPERLDLSSSTGLVEGQGVKHRVEACKKTYLFLAGGYSRSYKIRE
jgi:hypothetical protein